MTNLDIQKFAESARTALSGQSRTAAWMPRAAEIFLVAIIGLMLAQTAIAFVAPLPAPQGDAYAALSTPKAGQAQLDVKNPFPKADVVAEPVDAAPDIAETALDLTLTGVWPDEGEGSAIIRKPDGKERRFAVGDSIVDDVTLVAVYSDQVIIAQNGVREALRFEKKAVTPVAVPAQTRPAPTDTAKLDNAPAGGNPFRLAPAVDKQGAPAVAIYAGADRAAFTRAGFRDGDIVRMINGAPTPTDPGQLLGLFNRIKAAGSANLVVERDGENVPITLSLNGSGTE